MDVFSHDFPEELTCPNLRVDAQLIAQAGSAYGREKHHANFRNHFLQEPFLYFPAAGLNF
jgi:hypothetical protein